jgi:hypothetical protein
MISAIMRLKAFVQFNDQHFEQKNKDLKDKDKDIQIKFAPLLQCILHAPDHLFNNPVLLFV